MPKQSIKCNFYITNIQENGNSRKISHFIYLLYKKFCINITKMFFFMSLVFELISTLLRILSWENSVRIVIYHENV